MALIKNSVAMYEKMPELDEYGEMTEAPITGDALFADDLNDVSALSYVLKLVGGHLQQYDHLNLSTKFPVLDMDKISHETAWDNQFINLFLWIDDLDLETVCMTVTRWIRQFIEDDEEWNRDLSWSQDILIKVCTAKLKETIMREEQVLLVLDKAIQDDPITLVLVIKRLSGLRSRAMIQLYEYITKIDIKAIVGIVGIFMISIHEEFNTLFKAFLTQHELGDPAFTYQRVFDISDYLYRKSQDKLVSTESNQRGLLGSKSDIHHHNCGEEGHMQRDCTKPCKQLGGDLGPEWFKPLVLSILGISTVTCAFAMISFMTLVLVLSLSIFSMLMQGHHQSTHIHAGFGNLGACWFLLQYTNNVVVLPLISITQRFCSK